MTDRFSYAAITPVRDEAANLPRLAESLRRQTVKPTAWILIDNGSTDGTVELGQELVLTTPWIKFEALSDDGPVLRGGRIVRAFQAGLAFIEDDPDVIVKLDADVSMPPDYFQRLMAAFENDPKLGIASGCGYEEDGGTWRQRHVTGGHVWGASRAYRRRCLEDVLPLEERMGWDGIDELKASALDWKTETLDIPFRHHRREGERDGRASLAWAALGRASHYMGYRPWYLVLRALYHARREPAALALLWGYAGAALRREPRCADQTVRAALRERQSPLKVGRRMREVTERRSALKL